MPRKSVPAVTPPVLNNCLICWEIQRSRNFESLSEGFERLLKVFEVDSSYKLDLRVESFCGNCTTSLKQLLKVYDKLESLKEEVKKKVVLSQGKCFSQDLRINNFRTQILKQRDENAYSPDCVQSTSSTPHQYLINASTPTAFSLPAYLTPDPVDYVTINYAALAPQSCTNQQFYTPPNAQNISHEVQENSNQNSSEGYYENNDYGNEEDDDENYVSSSSKIKKKTNPNEDSKANKICEICGKKVQGSFCNLNEHLWTHKNEEEKEQARALGQAPTKFMAKESSKSKLKCATCGKNFWRRYLYENHVKTHLLSKKERKTIKCKWDGCETYFCSNDAMTSHVRMVHTKKLQKNVVCSECPLKFYYRKDLRKHITRTHAARQFTCDICNFTFAYEGEKIAHLKNHRPAENFVSQCDLCSKKFTKEEWMIKHRDKTHPDAPPVKKKQRFVRIPKEEFYRQTVKVREKLPPFEEKDDKLFFEGFEVWPLQRKSGFSCGQCWVAFRKDAKKNFTLTGCERSVKRHIKGVHLGHYTCQFCNKKCKSFEHLSKHRKSHIQDLEPCAICLRLVPSIPEMKKRIHAWSHKNVQEMIDTLKTGEPMPISVSKSTSSMATREDHELEIRCFVINCGSQEIFANVVNLQEHIRDNHPASIDPKYRFSRSDTKPDDTLWSHNNAEKHIKRKAVKENSHSTLEEDKMRISLRSLKRRCMSSKQCSPYLNLKPLPSCLKNANDIRVISTELLSYVSSKGMLKLVPLNQLENDYDDDELNEDEDEENDSGEEEDLEEIDIKPDISLILQELDFQNLEQESSNPNVNNATLME